MPFRHFLATSLNFERTHQLILQCLFNDPLFIEVATGVKIGNYRVVLEPEKSLFDLGIIDFNGEYVLLIELKMWSNLSGPQLERQRTFLEKRQCQGVHILLGTSDLQFYRDNQYDDIARDTFDHSYKVGYKELIRLLEQFIAAQDIRLPIVVIADNYREALLKQSSMLEKAWLDEQANAHFRAYSVYHKIKGFLLNESFSIYSVYNAGGADHILNDANSWTQFKFKGYDFEIYQEMLNREMTIRVYNEGVPNHIRHLLKEKIVGLLQKNDPFKLPWVSNCKASKYYKVAVYRPEILSMDDCERVAAMLKGLNTVIKEIVRKIKDQPVPELPLSQKVFNNGLNNIL